MQVCSGMLLECRSVNVRRTIDESRAVVVHTLKLCLELYANSAFKCDYMIAVGQLMCLDLCHTRLAICLLYVC